MKHKWRKATKEERAGRKDLSDVCAKCGMLRSHHFSQRAGALNGPTSYSAPWIRGGFLLTGGREGSLVPACIGGGADYYRRLFAIGFKVEWLGGNTQGLTKRLSDGRWMQVCAEGPRLPNDTDTTVLVATFPNKDDDPCVLSYPSLNAAVAVLESEVQS